MISGDGHNQVIHCLTVRGWQIAGCNFLTPTIAFHLKTIWNMLLFLNNIFGIIFPLILLAIKLFKKKSFLFALLRLLIKFPIRSNRSAIQLTHGKTNTKRESKNCINISSMKDILF